jgi:hypothetical protein
MPETANKSLEEIESLFEKDRYSRFMVEPEAALSRQKTNEEDKSIARDAHLGVAV